MLNRYAPLLLGGVLAVAGCQRSVEVVSGGEVAPATPANSSALPAGSMLHARLDNTISTEGNKVGDAVTLTVSDNVVAQNGSVVVPAGATIHGRVSALDDSDDPTDRAVVQLQFSELRFNGRSYPFRADVRSVASVEERKPGTGEVLRRAGTGAAIGGAIGAIVGGAELDAIIKGGLIGAAAGTVISLGAGDVEHRIPAGTRMTLQATQTVAIR